MVPLWPGASINGLYVVPPNTKSAQGSPVLGDMAASNGCMSANAAVTTGVVGAPAGPYGSLNVASTAFGPAGTAKISGLPVPATLIPTSFSASMVIGAVAVAKNWMVPTSVGRMNSPH